MAKKLAKQQVGGAATAHIGPHVAVVASSKKPSEKTQAYYIKRLKENPDSATARRQFDAYISGNRVNSRKATTLKKGGSVKSKKK